MSKPIPLKDWIVLTSKSPVESHFVTQITRPDFPFQWWDAASLNFSLASYKKLCPDDPYRIAMHSVRTTFDLCERYSQYLVDHKRREDQMATKASAEVNILEMADRVKQARKEQARQDRLAKKERIKAHKAENEINSKLGAEVEAMKHMAIFPKFIMRMVRNEDTEFANAFRSLALCNMFSTKRVRGNVRTTTALSMPDWCAAEVDRLYAVYIGTPGISPHKGRVL